MMAKGRMYNISDFEWASVARYTVYVSTQIGLKEFNLAEVYSFRLAALGIDGLKRRKVRLLGLLRQNMRDLEEWVKEHRDGLGQLELTVLRGMYTQYAEAVCQTEEHLGVIESLRDVYAPVIIQGEEDEEDELPF